MNLPVEILYHSIGAKVTNHKGETIGTITEMLYDQNREKIQYVVLSSNKFFGNKVRYFAIPAYSKLIRITKGGKIVIKADNNDLQLARGIPVEKCPKPIFEFDPSIYELYNYHIPSFEDSFFNKRRKMKKLKKGNSI